MAKFVINEEFLQQVETLQILIKNNIAGLFGGNHRTRNFGSSCEFADYRDYIAGDDITKIDWNAFARFEKLYSFCKEIGLPICTADIGLTAENRNEYVEKLVDEVYGKRWNVCNMPMYISRDMLINAIYYLDLYAEAH